MYERVHAPCSGCAPKRHFRTVMSFFWPPWSTENTETKNCIGVSMIVFNVEMGDHPSLRMGPRVKHSDDEVLPIVRFLSIPSPSIFGQTSSMGEVRKSIGSLKYLRHNCRAWFLRNRSRGSIRPDLARILLGRHLDRNQPTTVRQDRNRPQKAPVVQNLPASQICSYPQKV